VVIVREHRVDILRNEEGRLAAQASSFSPVSRKVGSAALRSACVDGCD
jgi:hypothetical protein